jgi:GNAT superfamily N-acetyltransferase
MTRPTFPVLYELADGSVASIRPVRPSDKGLLEAGFERLSRESRHRRFLRPVLSLTPRQLVYLTEVDGRNHAALIAVVRRGEDAVGGGVARYVRDREEPAHAEFAVAVTDGQHDQGLGTRLLELLIEVARENDLRMLVGLVHPENGAMLAVLARFDARLREEGSLLRVELDLGGDLSESSSPPGSG